MIYMLWSIILVPLELVITVCLLLCFVFSRVCSLIRSRVHVYTVASIKVDVEPINSADSKAVTSSSSAAATVTAAPVGATSGSGGAWYCFDDHIIRELDESALREPAHTGAAYLLFYQRRDSSPVPPPFRPATMDELMRGWALSESERRALRSYPGSTLHTKKKAQLSALQQDGNCVIL
jgi:hypothetical protein